MNYRIYRNNQSNRYNRKIQSNQSNRNNRKTQNNLSLSLGEGWGEVSKIT